MQKQFQQVQQQQILTLQQELKEIKKKTETATNKSSSNPQTPYQMDEDELEKEVGWIEQKRKEKIQEEYTVF